MNAIDNQTINNNHKLLSIFSRRDKRIIGVINTILFIILSLMLLIIGIFGDLLMRSIHINLFFLFMGILLLIPSIFMIINFGLPPDIKLFDDGIEYQIRKGLTNSETIFLSFNKIKAIDMIKIPIGIKCVVFRSINNEFRITGKELQNIDEFYKIVLQAFNSYNTKNLGKPPALIPS